MSIRDMYLDSLNVSTDMQTGVMQKRTTQSTGKDSFDAAFSSKRESYSSAKKQEKDFANTRSDADFASKSSNRYANKSDAYRENRAAMQSRQETTKTEKAQQSESKEAAENNTAIKEGITPEQEAAAAVSAVAQVLGITGEQLLGMLSELNMTAADLLEPEQLNTLLLAVTGFDSPTELLNVPEAPDMIRQIRELLEEQPEAIMKLLEQPAEELLDTLPAETLTQQPEMAPTSIPVEAQSVMQAQQLEDVAQMMPQQQTDLNSVNDAVLENQNQEVPPEAVAAVENQDASGGAAMQSGQQEGSALDMDAGATPIIIDHGETTTVEVNGKVEVHQNNKPNALEIINQLADKIKADINSEVSEIKINLRPDDLGEVVVKVLSENGVMTAKFFAENQQVKDTLDANLDSLKKVLEDQGLDVKEFSVDVGSEDAQEQMARFMQGQEKSERRIRQIMDRIASEEDGQIAETQSENYADPSGISGNNIDFSA